MVGQSLILLGSLTSLIAGLFIALQLHIYVNNLILELAGRFNLTNYAQYKMKVSRKKDFSSTLEEFYGNCLISIILLFMFLSYFIELISPNIEHPLWVFKPPLMKSDYVITFFLCFFLLFMVLNTLKSFNAWRNRLNFFNYFQYYQFNKKLLNDLQNSDQKDWLQEYRMMISTDWDRVEDLYTNRKYELESILENVTKFFEDFPEEYERRVIPENIRKYAQVEHKNIRSSKELFKPLTDFWNFWKKLPSILGNIYTNVNSLRIIAMMPFIHPTLATEFIDFRKRVNEIINAHSIMETMMDNLSGHTYDFGLKENEKEWLSGSNEPAYKQIFLIEQFPEHEKFLSDFFDIHKEQGKVYEGKFKPLVPKATYKFLEIEEVKPLTLFVEENVTARKLYSELLENLNKSVSNDLTMLNNCLDQIKTKKRNKIIQFFSRL